MAMVLLPFPLQIKAFVPSRGWGRNIWVGYHVPSMVANVHFPQAWITRDAFSRTLPNLGVWREKQISPLGFTYSWQPTLCLC